MTTHPPRIDRVRFTLLDDLTESPRAIIDTVRELARAALNEIAPADDDGFTYWFYDELLHDEIHLEYTEWSEMDIDYDGAQRYRMASLHVDFYLDRPYALMLVQGTYALAEQRGIAPVENVSRACRVDNEWVVQVEDLA